MKEKIDIESLQTRVNNMSLENLLVIRQRINAKLHGFQLEFYNYTTWLPRKTKKAYRKKLMLLYEDYLLVLLLVQQFIELKTELQVNGDNTGESGPESTDS